MIKILVIRNKKSIVELTYRKKLKDIGKELNVEILEYSNSEVWKMLNEGTLDKGISKVWLVAKDFHLAKKLELKGYQVFNSSKTIEICDNKGTQYVYLEDLMPKTKLCPVIYDAKDINVNEDFSKINYPCVLKKFYSSFGAGVYKINNEVELKDRIKKIDTYLFLIQDYIETGDNEYRAISYRAFVVNNKIIATMKNCNKTDYRTQTIHGGEHYKFDLPKEAEDIVLEAVKRLGNNFAGVDIFKDAKTNKWYISEVNNSSGLSILSKLYNKEMAEDVIEFIKNN